VVVDRHWNIVAANAGVALLTDGVAPELLEPPANALRVTLHPGGMAPRILNFAQWSSHLLERLRRQVETTDGELAAILDESPAIRALSSAWARPTAATRSSCRFGCGTTAACSSSSAP
jgi:hypothetical protein